MSKLMSASQAGEMMGLPHMEVIRRIRKKDIKADKIGWNYILTKKDVEEAMQSEWYKKIHTTNK
jgi:hypothetical protein